MHNYPRKTRSRTNALLLTVLLTTVLASSSPSGNAGPGDVYDCLVHTSSNENANIERAVELAECIVEPNPSCFPDLMKEGSSVELKGSAHYAIGAVVQSTCGPIVGTPYVPTIFDTGSVSKPYTVNVPALEDIQCTYVTKGNNHYKYSFTATAEMLPYAIYGGRFLLPSVEKSNIIFEMDFSETEWTQTYSGKINIGNKGAERTACEAEIVAKKAAAEEAAYRWVKQQLATSSVSDATLNLWFIYTAGAGWMAELTCSSIIVNLALDFWGSYDFEGEFLCTDESALELWVHVYGNSLATSPGVANEHVGVDA